MDAEAMILVLDYKDVDGEEKPVFYAFKHGLREVKLQLKLHTKTASFLLATATPAKSLQPYIISYPMFLPTKFILVNFDTRTFNMTIKVQKLYQQFIWQVIFKM